MFHFHFHIVVNEQIEHSKIFYEISNKIDVYKCVAISNIGHSDNKYTIKQVYATFFIVKVTFIFDSAYEF